MLPPLVTLLAPLLIRMPLSLATIALPLSVVTGYAARDTDAGTGGGNLTSTFGRDLVAAAFTDADTILPEISPPEVVTILLLPLIRRPSLTPVIFPGW